MEGKLLACRFCHRKEDFWWNKWFRNLWRGPELLGDESKIWQCNILEPRLSSITRWCVFAFFSLDCCCRGGKSLHLIVCDIYLLEIPIIIPNCTARSTQPNLAQNMLCSYSISRSSLYCRLDDSKLIRWIVSTSFASMPFTWSLDDCYHFFKLMVFNM